MTKTKFIAWIRHRLDGGRPDSSQDRKFHPDIIAIAVENAMADLMYEVFRKNPDQLDLYAKDYTSVAVSYNSTYRCFYATLPTSIVQLPDNNGVRWMADVLYPMDHFVPLTKQSAMNFNTLKIDRNDDRPAYYLNDQEIFFTGIKRGSAVTTGNIAENSYYLVDGDTVTYDGTVYGNGEIIKGTTETGFTGDGTVYGVTALATVMMALLVPFSELSDSDEFILPSGKRNEIMAEVWAYFGLAPADMINDSKSE